MPSTCQGKAAGSHCGGILYKCEKCGLVGCKNNRNGQNCSNNITRDSGGMCKNCGGVLRWL